MIMRFRIPGAVRYAASIGLSVGVIALSFMFMLEAPNGGGEAKATPQPTMRAAAVSKPLPKFTAADFNIARIIPVVAAGKPEPVTTAAVSAAQQSPRATSITATVTADAVNVRSGPSKTAPKTFVVRQGDAVEIIETRQGWSRITTSGGDSGWMWSKFLRG